MTATRAEDLARAFDDDFARPIAVRGAGTEDLLAIRIAGDPYAVTRSQLGGLFADRPVTALPGAVPGLLGISGFRGALVPVYDLRAVLGAGGGAAGSAAARWLVTAAGAPVALAFEQFEAFVRVPRDAIAAHGGVAADHAPRAVHAAGELRPILDIPSILAAIRGRVPRLS